MTELNNNGVQPGNELIMKQLARFEHHLATLEDKFRSHDHRFIAIEAANQEILLKLNNQALALESLPQQPPSTNHSHHHHQHHLQNQTNNNNSNNNNNNNSSNNNSRSHTTSNSSSVSSSPSVEVSQQQQQQQSQSSQQQELVDSQDMDSNAGLTYHLQQFLQQQTSLEDLCSSMGLDDSNQLVLAAAIHRALVDSVGSNGGQADTKPLGASSGPKLTHNQSPESNSSSNNNNNNSTTTNNNTPAKSNNSVSNLSRPLNTSGANLHLVESINCQRRAYNTRAALHSITSPTVTSRHQNSQAASTAALNLNNRAQQQRHAQAAAALSALSNAGSHTHQQLNSGTPIVDFECDTCGSSFDDRHRLMQHQSIHLELKKDWFTETPVHEVMKIFNRRRGEFLCNTCNLRFEATFDYDKHNHSVHGQRPYCCQFCGNGTRTFRFWRQYLNHLYDHRYVFSCTIEDCDFTVNRRDSLRFHIFRFHLNCQLPQSQHHGLRSNHNLMLDSSNCDSKWPSMEDDEDEDNEMSVGD